MAITELKRDLRPGLAWQGAIFDLDGTLLDSMHVWEQVDATCLGRRGIEVTEDYTQAVSSIGFSEAAVYTIERFGFPETPEELMREWNEMVAEEYEKNILLKPNARAYLDYLAEKGVKLGVATALSEALFAPVLKNNGVFHHFSAFASVDEVQRGKGFPDVYLLAAERLGVPPEQCAVFEDLLQGVRGAKAAGMTVYGVYDSYSACDAEEIRRLADGYVSDFAELME